VAWTKDTSGARFEPSHVPKFTSEQISPYFGSEMNELTENRIPLDDLMVFHQLARSLNSSLDLDTILRTILDQMERIIAADMWALLMLDESRKELYYAIASQNGEDALRDLRVKPGEGVAGWVMEHGETLIVPESEENDPRLQETLAADRRKVRSMIAMPLRGRKGVQGVIEILNPRASQMSDYTIAFLHILCDHAAIAIENARDVARIQQLTITDDATGLYNVRHLYKMLEQELERGGNQRLPVSLAFIDLDRFKLVNDVHGHLIGSELLGRVGKRLKQLSREKDMCFRYGGDEFVILMPDTAPADALMLATGLHHELLSTKFRMSNGLELTASASVGVATCPPENSAVHAIIGAADARMYAVKDTGRGKVRGA
jgi:diguanylate cyclase (GGDEF)-like protein